jgi:putative PEP-CTERM system TPR-repeat lipoprotein
MRKPSLLILILTASMALMFSGCNEQSREELIAQGGKFMSEGNAKGAAVIYKSLLEKNPDDIEVRFDLAKAYLEAGKPDQAEKEALSLAAKPNAPDRTQLLLGEARLAQGKATEAQADLEAFLLVAPDSAEAWENLGHVQMLKHDLQQAGEDYTRSLSITPGRIKAKLGLIEAELDQMQLDAAKVQLDELLAAHPGNQAGMHFLARLQTLQKDTSAAIATYKAIAAKYPSDHDARYWEAQLTLSTNGVTPMVEKAAESLKKDFPHQYEGYKLQGMVDYTKGAYGQAITSFQQAFRLRQQLDTKYFLALACARSNNIEMAISELQVVLDAAPRFTKGRRLLAGLNLRANRPDEAVAELNKVLEYAPDDELSLRMLGDIFLAKKDFDKSLEEFSAIPDDSDMAGLAHLRKGVIMASEGKASNAEAELRKSVELSGQKLDPRVYLAAFLMRSKKVDEAMAVLNLPEGTPSGDQAKANNAQALLLLQLGGHLDEAMAHLDKAKTLDPDLLTTYCNMARVYLLKKDPEHATEQFNQALARSPHDVEANSGLAYILINAGKPNEAIEHLKLAADSKQLRPYLNLAELYIKQRMSDEALKVLDQCLTVYQNNVQALVMKTRLLASKGDTPKAMETIRLIEPLDKKTALTEQLTIETAAQHWGEAEKVASNFIDLNPSSAESYLPLVSVKELQGDYPGASDVLQRALEKDKSNLPAQLSYGSLLIKMDKYNDAIEYFDRLIASNPSLAMAYTFRGLAHQQSGDVDAAAKDYETALGYQNTIPVALNNLAMIYADKPDMASKALERASAALALNGDNPTVIDTMGYVMLKNGRTSEALTYLKRAASMAPNNQAIAEHLKMANAAQP